MFLTAFWKAKANKGRQNIYEALLRSPRYPCKQALRLNAQVQKSQKKTEPTFTSYIRNNDYSVSESTIFETTITVWAMLYLRFDL